MAARNKSPRRKPKKTTKPEQSTTAGSKRFDAIAACKTASKSVAETSLFLVDARLTSQGNGDDEFHAQSVAEAVTPFVRRLDRLQHLLCDRSNVRALEAANAHRPVAVAGQQYASYCRAAFEIGVSLYREILAGAHGPDALCMTGFGYVVEFPEIEKAKVIEHWREISTKIVQRRWVVNDLRQLLVQLRFERNRLIIGQKHLAKPKKRLKQKRQFARFPALNDLRWEEVTIEFTSKDKIRVSARDKSKVFHFAEIGFKDGRKGDMPDTRWGMLMEFASHGGALRWTSDIDFKQKRRLSAVVKDLRHRLRAFMGITDDPFYPYKSKLAYVARFKLRDKSFHDKADASNLD